MARSASRRSPDVYRREYNQRVQRNLDRGLSYRAATGHAKRDVDGTPLEMSVRDANDFARGGSERLAEQFRTMDLGQKEAYLGSVAQVFPQLMLHDVWATLLGSPA